MSASSLSLTVHDAAQRRSYWDRLQYEGGDLYRAILGKEVFWDSEAEELAIKTLDAYYNSLDRYGNDTSIKPYRVKKRRLDLIGMAWFDNCLPENFFNPKSLKTSVRTQGPDIIYVREFSAKDEVPRVDIDAYCHRTKAERTVSIHPNEWSRIKSNKFVLALTEVSPNDPTKKGKLYALKQR